MKKNLLIALGIFLTLVFLFLKSCQYDRERASLIAQLSEYQLKEKSFELKIKDDSSTIAFQGQTIMSQKEAINLGLLEMEKDMKELQSQVKQKTNTMIVEKQIPFIPSGFADTSGLVRNEHGEVIRKDSIAIPMRFQLHEKWFNIDGYVKREGLTIDSLKIPNKTIVSVGYRKSGFLNLKKDAVIAFKNDNPYVNVVGMDNVVIKKKRKFYQSPLFTIGVGVALGYYLKK